jgi:hypothetical protein
MGSTDIAGALAIYDSKFELNSAMSVSTVL